MAASSSDQPRAKGKRTSAKPHTQTPASKLAAKLPPVRRDGSMNVCEAGRVGWGQHAQAIEVLLNAPLQLPRELPSLAEESIVLRHMIREVSWDLDTSSRKSEWADLLGDLQAIAALARGGHATEEALERLSAMRNAATYEGNYVTHDGITGLAHTRGLPEGVGPFGSRLARQKAGDLLRFFEGLRGEGRSPRQCAFERCGRGQDGDRRWFVPVRASHMHCCEQCRKNAHNPEPMHKT